MTENGDRLAATVGEAAEWYRQAIEAAHPGLRVDCATANDVDALDALNAFVVKTVTYSPIMRQTRDFFEPLITGGTGFVVALRSAGGDICGYSVGALCTDERHCFMPSPVVGDAPERAGLLFGTAIHPDYRGAGLQTLLVRLRLRVIGEMGREIVQATAPPNNTNSLANMMQCGLRVIGAARLLDDQPRYILEASANPGLRRWSGEFGADASPIAVPAADFDKHSFLMFKYGPPTSWKNGPRELVFLYDVNAPVTGEDTEQDPTPA